MQQLGNIHQVKAIVVVIMTMILGISPVVNASKALPLERLRLPEGFSISIFAEVDNPRQLAIDQAGIVYAGSRRGGKVHAIADLDQDGVADIVKVIAEGLTMPSGIAIRDNRLYIAAVNSILRSAPLSNILEKATTFTTIYKDFPKDRHHGWKFIDFGPDGLLYVPVGAPCNICLKENPVYASIQTLDVDAKRPKPKLHAAGVRNSVGFTWHPETKALWFTDNGRDQLGDESPPCELNIATAPGGHFGYPYVHGNDLLDPKFGQQVPDHELIPPALSLGPHVAPLGIAFPPEQAFPEGYRNQLFIAEHGSWNRSRSAGHTGHRITLARSGPTDGDSSALTYEVFIDGWLQNNTAWGRPVDILFSPDGSMLISDDHANVIYRVTYQKPKASSPPELNGDTL
ncbi:MAG: PQQ-dependent sugar dehydrogenase [Pseudomonadales bacterium]